MTSGEVSILTLAEREQWTREHASADLPSQSWSYASALAASGIEPKLAVVRSAQSWMLLPFFERERRGLVDVCTLYGLSGASACGDANALFTLWPFGKVGLLDTSNCRR